MVKIFVSILVAAFVVGNIFYVPYREVNANEAYLQAATYEALQGNTDVQSAILDNAPYGAGGAFTPMWERQRYQYNEEVTKLEIAEPEPEPEPEVESKEEERRKIEPEVLVVQSVAPKKPTPKITKATQPKTNEVERSVSVDPLVQELLVQINEMRSEKGLTVLTLDTTLSDTASTHSTDMAAHEYLSHTNLDNCSFTCRINASGYTATAWAENIGFIENMHLLQSTRAVASYMMRSWDESESHRVNILNKKYTQIGIGIAKHGNDIYITTDFALPK